MPKEMRYCSQANQLRVFGGTRLFGGTYVRCLISLPGLSAKRFTVYPAAVEHGARATEIRRHSIESSEEVVKRCVGLLLLEDGRTRVLIREREVYNTLTSLLRVL